MENIIHDDNDIEDYYKNIDKPIINNCINNLNLKNLLKLSTVVDLYLFTKKKNKKMRRKINIGGSEKRSGSDPPSLRSDSGIRLHDDKKCIEFPQSAEQQRNQIPEILHRSVDPYISDINCQNQILSDKTIVPDNFLDQFKNNNQQIELDYSEKIVGGSAFVNSIQNGETQSNTLLVSPLFDKETNNKQKVNNEFQMDQFTWKLKDKRELLKECEFKRKKIIKEASSSLNILSKGEKSSKLVNEIKIKNNNLLNNVENIDSIIETIENNFPTVVDEFIEIYSN